MRVPAGVHIDNPAAPLLQTAISYYDITTANGNALGTSMVCAGLANEPSYQGLLVKPLDGAAAGQVRPIATHIAGTNTLLVASPFTDNAGAVVQILAGTRFVILSIESVSNILDMLAAPSESLIETWSDPAVGISAARWTVTNPATGVAWARTVAGAFIYAQSVPNANEVARLRGNQQWRAHTLAIATRIIPVKFIFEFEMLLGNVVNIDNAIFICGLTPGIADTRATNNIIGFGLAADVLQTVTDLAGAETVNTGFGEVLAQHNKFRIEVSDTLVRFLLNGAVLASHITNLPDGPFYPMFYIDTEAGGAATIAIGWTRAWYETIVK